ncbi:hypothetical protein RKD55_002810 [Rossellomorea marisflavi]
MRVIPKRFFSGILSFQAREIGKGRFKAALARLRMYNTNCDMENET